MARSLAGLCLLLLSCFSLFASVTATVAKTPAVKAMVSCSASDDAVKFYVSRVRNPLAFCKWYNKFERIRSPFDAYTSKELTAVCKCIIKNPKFAKSTISPAKPIGPKVVGLARSRAVLANNIARPQRFCKFWLARPTRQHTPFATLTPKVLYSVCKAMLATTTSTRTTTSSTTIRAVPTTTPRAPTTLPPKVSTTVSFTSTTTKASTTTQKSCGANPTADLIPILNSANDASDVANLVPSKKVSLYFAQPSPGKSAGIITMEMHYPAVDLWTSSLVDSISCSPDGLSFVVMKSNAKAIQTVASWTAPMVLLTKHSSCNAENERGVWLVSGVKPSESIVSDTYTFTAAKATWADVADTMDVSYGERDGGPIRYAPACSSSYSHTSMTASTTSTTTSSAPDLATPSPTQRGFVDPKSLADLTPGARAIVDNILANIRYAPDGSFLVTPNNLTNSTIAQADWLPDDFAAQDAMEDKLAKVGMKTPDFFKKAADAAMAGQCLNNATNSTNTKRDLFIDYFQSPVEAEAPHGYSRFFKRFGWDDAWDIGCSDLVGAFTGDIGEAACAGKDIYDNRQAFSCMFKGCFMATVKQPDPPPPVWTYDFTYAGNAKFFFAPNTKVVTWGSAHSLTCIDCSLNIGSLNLKGQIKVILATGEILAAGMTVTESSTANMILGLKTSGGLSYNWNTKVNTIPLDPLSFSGVFSISPQIIFSIGAEFSTDKSVDVSAGARMTWSGSNADVDMTSGNVNNIRNWMPSLQVTTPVFNTAATVKMYPYMRRLYEISFTILGSKISNKVTFTSQTALGYNTQYLDTTAAGSCKVGQLRLQSYASNIQNLVFQNGYSVPLNNLGGVQPERCYDVPSERPTDDEIKQLQASAGQFCTEYNGYVAPQVPFYTTGTTSMDTSVTTQTTVQVATTPLVTTTVGTNVLATQVVRTTTTITDPGSSPLTLAAQYQKRDLNEVLPTATNSPSPVLREPVITHADIGKRAAATPALVVGWDPTKIRFACSKVATGTKTLTYTTSYKTVYTFTTTATNTYYTLVGAEPLTSTSTETSYLWTTTTSYTATQTQYASCPLQTQASCFTVTGHGSPAIEGKKLSLKSDVAHASFRSSNPAVFYLSCDQSLVALPGVRALTSTNGLFNFQPYDTTDSSSRIKCAKDVVTKELTCTATSGDTLAYVWEPTTPYWKQSLPSYKSFTPKNDPSVHWPSFVASSAQYRPISFTYEPVACPCGDAASTKALTVYDASTPSCPTSDGTSWIPSSSSVAAYQVQCNIKYSGAVIQSSTQTSYAACAALCGADGSCVAATWDVTSQLCSKLSSISGAAQDDGAGTPVHSLVRYLGTTPAVVLTNPIAITGIDSNGLATDEATDRAPFVVDLPFPISLYGTSSSRVWINNKGWISLVDTNLYTYIPVSLPFASTYTAMPDTVWMPFWNDLRTYTGTPQGMYYQIDGNAPNRYVTFEFYLDLWNNPNHFNHFSMKYQEGRPNAAVYTYYQISTAMPSTGHYATVGASKKSTGQYVQYSTAGTPRICSGLELTLHADTNTFTTNGKDCPAVAPTT